MGKIIALSGFKGSGKDTIAQLISKNHNGQTYIFSFADPIRQIISTLYNIDVPEYSKKEKTIFNVKGKNMTYRNLMISVGTHIRKFDNDVFTKAIEHQVNNTLQQNEDAVIVISDVRYNREVSMLERLKAKGHTVDHWLILRKNAIPNWVHMFGSELATNKVFQTIVKRDFKVNSSEYELLFSNCKFQRVIHNDGSINETSRVVSDLLNN